MGRSTSPVDRYGRIRVRTRRRTPTWRHLRPSSQTDSQLSDGPYARYLHRVARTLGESGWGELCAIDRPGFYGDLLLARWVVPYECSPERVAHRLSRARGRSNVTEDPETVRHLYRFADVVLGGAPARGVHATPRQIGSAPRR